MRYYEFVRVPSRLELTIGQINGLRSFIKKTNDKREYRRAVAVFQKADGKTYDYIARVHKVHIRTTKKWIYDYIKKGIEGLKIRKNHGGPKPGITEESKEIILSVLFNDPHIFGYLRNKWSLRSLARCLTDELDIPISFKHLQRITRDLGVRCKRPKLELLHGKDYEEGKKHAKILWSIRMCGLEIVYGLRTSNYLGVGSFNGRLNVNVAPFPSALFSAHIMPS